MDTSKRDNWTRVIAPRFARAMDHLQLAANGATPRYDPDPVILKAELDAVQATIDVLRDVYGLAPVAAHVPIIPKATPDAPQPIRGTLGRSYAAWALDRLTTDGRSGIADAVAFLKRGLAYEGEGR